MRGIPLILAGCFMLMFTLAYYGLVIFPPEEISEPYSMAILSNKPIENIYTIWTTGNKEEDNLVYFHIEDVSIWIDNLYLNQSNSITLNVDNFVLRIIDGEKEYKNIISGNFGAYYISKQSVLYNYYVSCIGHISPDLKTGYLKASMPSMLAIESFDGENRFVVKENEEPYLLYVDLAKNDNLCNIVLMLGIFSITIENIEIKEFILKIPNKDNKDFLFLASAEFENNILTVKTVADNCELITTKTFVHKKFIYTEEIGSLALCVLDNYNHYSEIIVIENVMVAGVLPLEIEKMAIPLILIILAIMLIIIGLVVEIKEKQIIKVR